MSERDCRAELVLAERRGELSGVQRVALGNHLRVCESCRILHSHGHAFDHAGGFEPGDADRLHSMVSASERWLRQPRALSGSPRPRRVGRFVLLAAVLFGTAAAAGTAGLIVRSSTHAPTRVSISTQPAKVAVASQLNSSAPQPTEASEAADGEIEPPTTAQLLPEAEPKRTRARSNELVARPSLTAPQLLQQANSARRSGDSVGAARLFQKLQRTFPTSREAKLSMVGFGSLLLEQGQSAAALAQFNRYLASSSGQNLTAEALYGKGRALSRLGRLSEEQTVWAQLLQRFPSSPYVSHARKRLGTAD